jgi:hypothetical protein
LPLTPELWSDVLLPTAVGLGSLVSAILTDRSAALVYYGLSALDDTTLQWVSRDRAMLSHFRKHAEIFAAFGRSVHIGDGRVIVPGGSDAEPLWRAIVSADPARPDEFVARLISGDGRLAFLYDVVAHLDGAHQRFALGLHLPAGSREARLRSVLAAFTDAAPEWKVAERPFVRPPLDGAILLSTIHVTETGGAVPPMTRRLWDRVFRGDELNDVPYEEVSDGVLRATSASLVLDASWLADRILKTPYAIGRRRLDTLLFGERVFHVTPDPDSADVATALRGYLAFPALMIALERIGVTDPQVYIRAARHAARLNTIQPVSERRTAIAIFQSAIELIVRMRLVHAINGARAASLVTSLIDLESSSPAASAAAFREWFRTTLVADLPTRESLEESLIAALAGLPKDVGEFPTVEWEGRRYLVNPAAGEFTRIRTIRRTQQGPTLDDALSAANTEVLADALISTVYAIHLGNPEGAAVTSGNVALRHDFGFPTSPTARTTDAWHIPIERFDTRTAWRVRGALLGLEAALPRLTLREIDRTDMPGEPTLASQDRQTVMLTAALMNSSAVSDRSRDAIASAIARGRDRVAALNPSRVDEAASAAGLSEWRHRALAWSVAQRDDVVSAFSLLELFWLGGPTSRDAAALDAWGAAMFPLTGCLCLELPPPGPWEDLAGYAAALLGTRGVDVPLKIAETLSTLKLPATMAPALAGFVTQDVLDHARLAYPDDWEAFSRAVADIPAERMADYVAALTVNGPLVEIK